MGDNGIDDNEQLSDLPTPGQRVSIKCSLDNPSDQETDRDDVSVRSGSSDLLTPAQRPMAEADDGEADQSRDLSCDDNNADGDERLSEMEDTDFRCVIEYRQLVKLYRENPKDKCIQMILWKYESDESKLDQLRCDYFEHLKQVDDDMPFDHSAGLKRRVATRSGEPVATRLARDIYNIVAVTEGGDYSLLREMLSTSKTQRQRLQSTTTTSTNKGTEKCQCCNDILVLKDTISALQSSVLLLRQSLHASEMMRQEQINFIKCENMKIKTYVRDCAQGVGNISSSTVSAMANCTRSLVARITEIEDRVRGLEVHLEHQNIIPGNTVPPAVHTQLNGSVQEDSNVAPPQVDHVLRALKINSFSKPTSVTNSGAVQRNPGHDVTSALPGKPVPVRLTRREDGNSDSAGWLDDDFRLVERKRVERFCLFGLSSRLNETLLLRDIEERGPKVRGISVFPLRSDRSQVRVKLTLVADERAGLVMSDDFFPSYVTCRPWISREAASDRRHNQSRYPGSNEDRMFGRQPYEIPPRFRGRNEERGSGHRRTKPMMRTDPWANKFSAIAEVD